MVKGNFSALCDSFLTLTKEVTQDNLNEIFRNFKNLATSANDTLFPNITQEFQRIQDTFQNLTFTSTRIEGLFKNAIEKLV